MTIYVALLRGINVGGKNKIKMADLRAMCEEMGLAHVQTYIQSGNIVFSSDRGKERVRQELEDGIRQRFQLEIVVILRTHEELEQILAQCPFSSEEIAAAEQASANESLYVALLLQSPLPEAVNQLSVSYDDRTDKYVIMQDNVYLLFRESVRNSKLASRLNKLSTPSTMRNWKTMTKLVEMIRETKT